MLDPQARALLDLMAERGVPPTHTLTPTAARTFYRERRAITQPDPRPVDQVLDVQATGPAGPIGLRLYRPAGLDPLAPALVYYHGGGWVIGDLDTHDTLCRELALDGRCIVVAVDYRMGPEHRFPAAVDDAVAALRWIQAQAHTLGIDPGRLAVGGDSAGGNLAAVVCLVLRDAGQPLQPKLQLLIYPATDMRAVAPSHTTNGQGYLLTADTIAYFRGHYLSAEQYADWRASPLLHGRFDGLPAAFVLTAGFDPLRDEGRQYADALSAAGTPARYVCFERQIHGFVLMGRVLAEARTAVQLCAQVLRESFSAT
jgi:acetyl esterase